MDLTNLEGISDKIQLSSGEQYLRRSIYIMFANANKLEKLYTDVLARFKKYISTNLLQDKYDEDILHFFLKSKKSASTIGNMKEQDKINVNVEIHSCPLLPTINIEPSLKISGQILTKMNEIGYQHLYILMADSSESSDTNTSDSDSGDCVPLKKRLKTCQKAIEVNSNESMLELHIKNTSILTGSTVNVDILIFMDEEFSKQLCDYLGLIYVEAILKAEGKDIYNVMYRLNNKTSKLYRLIQSYINKYLMNGYNNICIVNNISLWENFNANVRAVISTDTKNLDKNVDFIRAVKKSNFQVELSKNNISLLDYVESIAVIINKAFNFESHVVAKYECEENCYRNVKLPLISIIPLYILRYFRHCRVVEENAD